MSVIYVPFSATQAANNSAEQLLGLSSKYTEQKRDAIRAAFGYEGVEVFDAEEAMVKGKLGHPVWMPVMLESVAWSTKQGNEFVTHIAEEMLIDVAIIEHSRVKYTEETPMDGYDGVVIEYGGLGAWEISIKGILLGQDDEYPMEEYKNMCEFDNCPKSVGIACDLSNALGIEKMMIKQISFMAMPGVQNAQAFEIKGVQDKDLLLNLKNEL